MGVKSMENRVYSIIIICLLVLIALISWERGRSGRYQISGNNCLDTRTGEIYVLERVEASDESRVFLWYYVGKPRKDINSEEITKKVIKKFQQKEVK